MSTHANRASSSSPNGVGAERRKWVTAGLMLSMMVAALEQTVVSTAMPTIIGELNGLQIYPWVFSAYLLAATVTMPLYGKLADHYGRKRVVLLGIFLFLAGSIACGCAGSMPQLIAFRVLQGVGAGAIMPVTLTILSDLYSLEQRAKVQGLFSSVWGVSSLAGPALGGWITEYVSWRWVFFVTVPVGAMASVILMRAFVERVERRDVQVDYLGAVYLAVAAAALLLGVLGGEHSLSGAATVGLFGLSALSTAAFVRQSRRATDPLLPPDLFKNPQILTALVGSFLLGSTIFGIDTYVPLFVQGVRGGSAISAGKVITPVLFTWSISTTVATPLMVRWGFRRLAIIGTCLVAFGLSLLVLASAVGASDWAITASMAVTGLGLGPASTSFLLGAQHAVEWNRRGVATSAVSFFRTVGGALGVGILGGLLTTGLGRRLAALGESSVSVSAALTPEARAGLSPEALATVQGALAASLHWVFVAMLVVALGGMVSAWIIREPRTERAKAESEPAEQPEPEMVAP